MTATLNPNITDYLALNHDAIDGLNICYRTGAQLFADADIMQIPQELDGLARAREALGKDPRNSELGVDLNLKDRYAAFGKMLDTLAQTNRTKRADLEQTRTAIERGQRVRTTGGHWETVGPLPTDNVVAFWQRQENRDLFRDLNSAARRDVLLRAMKDGDESFLRSLEEAPSRTMAVLNETERQLIYDWRWRSSGVAETHAKQMESVDYADRMIEKARGVVVTRKLAMR